MAKKNVISSILAITGTALVWIPILAPILFSLAAFISRGIFRFDYLMPAELFPSVLVGGGLLIWAALRVGSRQRIIGWSLGLAVFLLFGGQILATVTGLASGEAEPAGWGWALVLASLVVYSISIVVMGTGGLLLLRDLFNSRRGPSETQ